MKELLEIDKIKELYPEEWVLLGNPVIINTKVMSGTPIYHAKDKRDIAAKKINWRENYQGATTIFTGEFPKKRRFWL